MTTYYDKEALAEEWHNLLAKLDPTHPEYVNTPIADGIDSYTLAYAILCLKEGLLDSNGERVGAAWQAN